VKVRRAFLRRRGLRAAVVLAFCLVACEAALRIAGHVYLQRYYTPGAAAPGPVITIVCLGESSTAGLWVPVEDSYPLQLQRSLRALYGDDRIRSIVPPHVGQNTSQMANRIEEYLELYRPRLVIVMAGANNEWSLAESHIARFVPASDPRGLEIRLLTALDGLRVFKLLRWTYLRLTAGGSVETRRDVRYVWGHPELARYPPEAWTYGFASDHRDAFRRLWRSDLETIVEACGRRNARVLLMTYPVNPGALPAEEFVRLAGAFGLPLARNDEAFTALARDGRIHRYLFRDHWHPNARGYTLVAGNALRAIVESDLLGLGRRAAPATGTDEALAEPPAAPPPLPEGGVLELGSDVAEVYLGDGWSLPEGSFRWTDQARAELAFGRPPRTALSLRLRLRPFLVPGRLVSQRLGLSLNGVELGRRTLSAPEPIELVFAVPAATLGERNLLRFELPDARSPLSVGSGQDPRGLGVAVEWLRLE
jgi:lysophospholipase L1-like esterase